MFGPIGMVLRRHWRAGTWSGTYACSGIDGATEGPQGPYNQPVAMQVMGNKATLEHTTRGGGFESQEGEFDDFRQEGTFTMVCEGQNTPEDKWRTEFNGGVEGKRLVAKGAVIVQRTILRTCQLDLVLGAAPAASTAMASTAAAAATPPAPSQAPAVQTPPPAAAPCTTEQVGAARKAGSWCK